MNGGAWESVMGVMEDNTNTSTPMSGTSTELNSGYSGKLYSDGTYTDYIGESFPAKKYYDLYPYSIEFESQSAFNKSKLGDAVGEVHWWYNDGAYTTSADNPWYGRSGRATYGSGSGIFSFDHGGGNGYSHIGTRSILIKY